MRIWTKRWTKRTTLVIPWSLAADNNRLANLSSLGCLNQRINTAQIWLGDRLLSAVVHYILLTLFEGQSTFTYIRTQDGRIDSTSTSTVPCRTCCSILTCNPLPSFQMFDWIYHNRDAFMSSYVEIGHSFTTAKKLQDDHNHFTLNSNVRSHLPD